MVFLTPVLRTIFEEEFVKGFAYQGLGTLEQFGKNSIRSYSTSVLKVTWKWYFVKIKLLSLKYVF